MEGKWEWQMQKAEKKITNKQTKKKKHKKSTRIKQLNPTENIYHSLQAASSVQDDANAAQQCV